MHQEKVIVCGFLVFIDIGSVRPSFKRFNAINQIQFKWV